MVSQNPVNVVQLIEYSFVMGCWKLADIISSNMFILSHEGSGLVTHAFTDDKKD